MQNKNKEKTLKTTGLEPLAYIGQDFWADAKIDNLFLVMSYEKKYLKLEKAIKNFFKGIYEVRMEKDSYGKVLEGICEKINDADFGIVVLAGFKKTIKGKRKCSVRMNIPYEYGMFTILNKPVMLMYERNNNFDINTEFSDIRNEHYEPFGLSRQHRTMERQISEIFIKFIPELAKSIANGMMQQIQKRNKRLYDSIKDKDKLKKALITIHENEIKNDFRSKLGGDIN